MIIYCHSMFIASIDKQIHINSIFTILISLLNSFLNLHTYSHSLPMIYTLVYTIFPFVFFVKNKIMKKTTPTKKAKIYSKRKLVKTNLFIRHTRTAERLKSLKTVKKKKKMKHFSFRAFFVVFVFVIPFLCIAHTY